MQICLKAMNLWNNYQVYCVECVFKNKPILLIVFYAMQNVLLSVFSLPISLKTIKSPYNLHEIRNMTH